MLSKWRHYVWCISLVVCATALVLWPRSYGSCFDARYVVSPTPLTWWGGGVSSTEGLLFFGVLKHDRPRPDLRERGGFDFQTSRGNQRLWSWAFAYLTQMATFGHRWHKFGVLHQGGVQVEDETETQ